MYKSIYVPLDNSKHSDRAAELAVALGEKLKPKLIGSHVYAAKMHEYRFKQMEYSLPEKYLEEDELKKQRRIHDSLITLGLKLISESYLDKMKNQCEAAGLDFEYYEGRLFAPCQNFPLDILFLRDDDIPEYVQDGVADLGVVGLNVVQEKAAQVIQLDALGFGTCTLSIAVPRKSSISSVYDLEGKLLYEFGGNSSITIATPYAKFGLLFVTSGYVGDRKKPIFAIHPGAKGDISLETGDDKNDYVAWCQRRAGPYNPSTIIFGDLMYVLLDRGLVACYEAKTGKHVYGPERIVSRGGAFTSSPWAYNGKVFFLDENGVTYVLQAGRIFKLLPANRLHAKEDMCMATPAMAGDKLIIRTDARVYCFKKAGIGSKSESK